MRYKVYSENPDRTLSLHSYLIKKGDNLVTRTSNLIAFDKSDEKEDGVYFKHRMRSYALPESHPFFNYDLLEDYILPSIPLSRNKVKLYTYTQTKRVRNMFYNYISLLKFNTKSNEI